MFSNGDDYFADRYATKIERFSQLLKRAVEKGDPMAEEFAEAWLDILDLIIEQQVKTTDFVNRVVDYYASLSKPPAE